jgi:hypothetical protein
MHKIIILHNVIDPLSSHLILSICFNDRDQPVRSFATVRYVATDFGGVSRRKNDG